MKNLKLLATGLFFCLLANNLAAQIQQIKIVSFTVKNQLPAIIDNWTSTPAALILVVQKIPSPIAMKGVRLVLQIKAGGAVVCGNTPANARPVDPFDVRTFNTADITGFLTNCHELKEGTYTICVQFFNIDKVAISQEVCKDFKVEEAAVEYSPPTLITPDNGKKLTAQELQNVVVFRWTPLVPKPKEPVTYRIKVWQLMQGQNATTAMRTNQPIVTKDVDNITQATVSGIYTGPCRPPYVCDFVWQVQAVNSSGKPMGNNNGTSEPYTFGLADEKSKGPDNVFPEDRKSLSPDEAKREVMFRWTPIVPKPQEPVTYRLKVWQLMQGQSGSQAMKTNQPIVTKDVDNITQATASGIYTGPCKPPYLCDFIWSVQALTKEGTITGTSEPTTFSVTAENSKGPDNVFPEDQKKLSSKDMANPVLFRWTPIVPKPQQTVTYRLKVWQLMQGQSGSQAMRTNQPIVTKDVDNITEATVSNIYTGPCKPPYLCDFIWVVEARIKNAAGISELIATSSPSAFAYVESTDDTSIIEGRITLSNSFPENKREFKPDEIKQAVTFRWTPVVPKPQQAVTYRLKVWQLMQGQSASQAMKTNQPIVTKDVDNITEATVSNIYTGPCKPPYLCDFIWVVEARIKNAAGISELIATSSPSAFLVVESTDDTSIIEGRITLSNSFPENKREFKPDEIKQAVTFRWTPVVPKPQQAVTYRLKVWQLMQGQSGSQAMRTNQPIVTKDVANITETTVSGIYTGPCKPPYLCDFIWSVEARTTQAGAAPRIIGTSEATTFNLKTELQTQIILPITEYTAPKLIAPDNGNKVLPGSVGEMLLFKWTAVTPKTPEPVTYRLRVWQLMQGQNASQVMRTNQPIVTKDVDNITEVTISNIYTGPCKPPYLCDFIWNVQAITYNGMAISTSKTFHLEIVIK